MKFQGGTAAHIRLIELYTLGNILCKEDWMFVRTKNSVVQGGSGILFEKHGLRIRHSREVFEMRMGEVVNWGVGQRVHVRET